MSANHISDDVMIDALYGIAEAGVDEHVMACGVCRARWNELQEKRGAVAATSINASAAMLAMQRRSIFRRVEHPSLTERVLGNATSRWAAPVLAGAAAGVLAIALFVHNPGSLTGARTTSAEYQAEAANPVGGDTQVFNEVYAMEQSFEPSASSSLGVLFEQPEGGTSPDSKQ